MLRAIFFFQKILLKLSFRWFQFATPRTKRKRIDWVVGADELASMVFQISKALDNCYSVSFTREGAYDFDYDFSLNTYGSAGRRARAKLILGPILLGRLANEARGFLYVGPTGFLLESVDQREFELRFLRKRGLKTGIYWCGSEIRSTKKMHELEREMGLPNISTYIGLVSPYFETEQHERLQQQRARVAMANTDVMFDFPTDQSSYLTGWREPFLYFMPEERFGSNDAKFSDLTRPVVTHASTSPMIKGTPLVRSAVARLKDEGYEFEYVELIGVSNEHLLKELNRSHIALNQFYGFTTAVFGVEAMAAKCALLASSDETIETHLPPGQNDVILVTKHWQVYDHLKSLLDHPERIKPLATAGQDWMRRYASAESAGKILQGILDSVLDGSYDKDARAALPREVIYGNQDPRDTD